MLNHNLNAKHSFKTQNSLENEILKTGEKQNRETRNKKLKFRWKSRFEWENKI